MGRGTWTGVLIGALACPAPPAPAQEADTACLRFLTEAGVAYRSLPPEGGMHTPVEITGAIGPVMLAPRGRSRPIMDCTLARALHHAREVFDELGVQTLSFSAAYHYRNRRDAEVLSAHAYGLAIDVHEVGATSGTWNVLRDFEPAVGQWHGLDRRTGTVEACVGQPRTANGRALRTLACRLKLHPAFVVIVTPDDNADHRDHLHIEAAAGFYPPPSPSPAPAPRPSAGAGVRPTAAPTKNAVAKRKARAAKERARKKVGRAAVRLRESSSGSGRARPAPTRAIPTNRH